MRTTLDIADDVFHAVKERARREDKTTGEVVSGLLRQALTASPSLSGLAARETNVVHGLVPFPPRGGTITNDLIKRLRTDDA